ncbi:MAG: VIT domain-containing protein, partial [Myxococcota bacterium]
MTMTALLASVWVGSARAEAPPVDRFDPPAFEVDGGRGGLTLVHTAVHAEVQLGMAVVDVTQRFHNPYDHPIDATYLFPLPPEAAVRSMDLTCGGRRISGLLLDRAAARARYEAAAAEGRTAALLEQERPNLFRQSVASLCPGEDVVVDLQYVDPLVLEDGRRELVFPTTVGPRYHPDGVAEPPFTTLPAHTVEIEVVIDEGMPVASIWSDSHVIDLGPEAADHVTTIRTDPAATAPNREFHLGWAFAGSAPQLAAVAIPPTATADGYLGVTLEPQLLEDLGPTRGRELLFVLDESCSMQGEPFAAEQRAVRTALDRMGPDDTFDLVRFSNTASAMFAEPQPNTAANRAAAEAWLEVFDGGGTEMTAGIVHSLTLPGDPARLRLVLLLTDGYIGDEQQVLDTVAANLGDARLFSLGVGSAVNRYLLDALAEVGRGDVSYQLPETPVAETVDRFYARIAHPALTDLAIDWGGLDVREVYPSVLPDLFAGQPVRVVARYAGALPPTTIALTGATATDTFRVQRALSLADADVDGLQGALPTLWARRKIADLGRTLARQPEALEREVTAVALAHHLVSDYTALVATETRRSTCGPAQGTIEVPSMLPDGFGFAVAD